MKVRPEIMQALQDNKYGVDAPKVNPDGITMLEADPADQEALQRGYHYPQQPKQPQKMLKPQKIK